MIEQLDIVKGCVGKKNLLPVLKHLQIKNGWVTSTNGRMTISTPMPDLTDLELIVPADKFITAVKQCKSPKFKITETHRLSIREGRYRVLVPLLQEEFPTPTAGGEQVQCTELLPALKAVADFMGDDASRPWACGVLIHKGMAYATNNTIICRLPIDWQGPSVNLPSFLVLELLRLKLQPVTIQATQSTITILLEGNVWLNSALLPMSWPNAGALFDSVDFNNLPPVPEELADAIAAILPFCPDPKFPRIKFSETGVSTDAGDQEGTFEILGLTESYWRAEPLLLLLSHAAQGALSADFAHHPRPCPWKTNTALHGLIIGLKQ